MPYANEHAARVRDPEDFIQESFRTKKLADGLSVIVGKLTNGDGSMVAQTYRFDKSKFTPEQTKKWLSDNDVKPISFEPASESKSLLVRSVFAMDNIETRETGGNRSVIGYAAKFNSRSVKFGDFFETIKPGAFARSVSDGKVQAIWNHNPDIVLGNQRNGTLQLVEDSQGLMFDLSMPDTQWGHDAYTLIKRKDVDGMSFGFRIRKSDWTRDGSDKIRSLMDVDLKEISPTAFPAYQTTSVEARAVVDDYYDNVLSNVEAEKEIDDEAEIVRIYSFAKNLTL